MGDYAEGQNGPWAKVEKKKLQTCIKPWTVPHLAFSWTLVLVKTCIFRNTNLKVGIRNIAWRSVPMLCSKLLTSIFCTQCVSTFTISLCTRSIKKISASPQCYYFLFYQNTSLKKGVYFSNILKYIISRSQTKWVSCHPCLRRLRVCDAIKRWR